MKAVFANHVGSSSGELIEMDTGWHGASSPSHSGVRNEEARVEANRCGVAATVAGAAQGGGG